MILKKSLYLLLCFVFLAAFGFGEANAQGRARIVKQTSSQPTNQPQAPIDKTKTTLLSQPTTRPTLTNKIIVVNSNQNQPLVKKTASSLPTNAASNSSSMYSAGFVKRMFGAIQSKIGIPYRYGSEGPNSYDCSSFVAAVFQSTGMAFVRSSARTYWAGSSPSPAMTGNRFGTLVFFNRLGHVGIVADSKGFYHASSSKGITYSPFEGYWEKRIVGFRRVPVNINF